MRIQQQHLPRNHSSFGESEVCQKQQPSSNLATDHTMNPVDTESFRAAAGSLDPNSNPGTEMEKIGKKANDYDAYEQSVSQGLPTQGIAPAVASDPLMRQAYAMPAAGFTSPQQFDQSPSRQYKMASDIFGTGMDRSWTASPPGSAPQTTRGTTQRAVAGIQSPMSTIPGSFKITEFFPSTPLGNDEFANSPAGRRARESSGNPLTGQGFDQENLKTGKRYFEGSNANQKLW